MNGGREEGSQLGTAPRQAPLTFHVLLLQQEQEQEAGSPQQHPHPCQGPAGTQVCRVGSASAKGPWHPPTKSPQRPPGSTMGWVPPLSPTPAPRTLTLVQGTSPEHGTSAVLRVPDLWAWGHVTHCLVPACCPLAAHTDLPAVPRCQVPLQLLLQQPRMSRSLQQWQG